MPFLFLKYLQPTHYFQCRRANGNFVFPQTSRLPDKVLNQLHRDFKFQSQLAQDYDLSWQAIQNGYIGNTEVYTDFQIVSIRDNYHFIRKYFNAAWVVYVLLVRLFSLYNPIVEIKGWYNTRNIKRTQKPIKPISYDDWFVFNSKLIKQASLVSVIIPTLNRYEYLKDVLTDLEKQDYPNFEVVIVDQSDDFKVDFYTDFKLDIQLVRQDEKALWLARNTAIKAAKGELIALSEDDVRIKPDWISEHLKCLDFFEAKVSAGVFFPKGEKIPVERSYFALPSQFATGNAMLYKHVFKKVGLFDRQFEKQRMGDGEFGLRIYLENVKSISNPYACCIDIKAGTGGLREMGSWDSFKPSSLFAPRPFPSVLYFFRRYFGNKSARLALLKTVPLSMISFKFKQNKPILILKIFGGILMTPIVMYQVLKSWRLSTIKIKEGPIIETIN